MLHPCKCSNEHRVANVQIHRGIKPQVAQLKDVTAVKAARQKAATERGPGPEGNQEPAGVTGSQHRLRWVWIRRVSATTARVSRSSPAGFQVAWGTGARRRWRRRDPSSARLSPDTRGTSRQLVPARGTKRGSRAPTRTGSSRARPTRTSCGGVGGSGGAGLARGDWGILLQWLSSCTYKHSNTVDEWKFPKSSYKPSDCLDLFNSISSPRGLPYFFSTLGFAKPQKRHV